MCSDSGTMEKTIRQLTMIACLIVSLFATSAILIEAKAPTEIAVESVLDFEVSESYTHLRTTQVRKKRTTGLLLGHSILASPQCRLNLVSFKSPTERDHHNGFGGYLRT